jgi:hypothetical protein
VPHSTHAGVSVVLHCPWKNVPAPHDTTQLAQLLRPTLPAKDPAAHAAQLVAFGPPENVPRGQLSHAVRPALAWNKPGWQGTQPADCAVFTKPAGHGAHCRSLTAVGATDSYSLTPHTVSAVQASVELVGVHSPVR